MKKIATLIVLMALSSISVFAQSNERINKIGKGRYTAVTNDIFSQPQYTSEATLDGLGLKTAEELGYTGRRVYNEYPEGPKIVTLKGIAKIYYDTASMEPMYIDGCIVHGKRRPNRIKFVDTETVVEKTVEKVVEKPVEKIVENR